MENPFSKSAPASAVTTRRAHSDTRRRFSPSFGVHKGYIKDPNWPPAHFPEEGVASARRFRRVEIAFDVELVDGLHAVKGDLSLGGAMFLLPERSGDAQVTVKAKGLTARADVLSVSPKGALFAHHCRFVEESEGRALFEAISS